MVKSKIFSFGKIAYYGKQKINEVTLEINLRDWNGYPEFTAVADVWNSKHTDIIAGGQMLEELQKEFPRLKFNIIYNTIIELWRKYHCKNISNIPAEDKEKIELLFSDIEREILVTVLKDKKQQAKEA